MRGALLDIAEARERVRAVGAAPLWALSDAEARHAVAECRALLAECQAVYLAVVHDLDTRPEAVAGARPGEVALAFLRREANASPGQARRDVEAARAVHAGGLTATGAALAAGEISREHLDVAVRTLTRIPGHLRDEVLAPAGDEDGPAESGDAAADGVVPGAGLQVAAAVDAFFADQARSFPPRTVDRLATELLQVIAPDRADRWDPRAYERRRLQLVRADDGLVLVRGQIGGPAALWLLNAVARHAAPQPTYTGPHGEVIQDQRTTAQRNADALAEICRRACQGEGEVATGARTADGAPVQVVVVVRSDEASVEDATSGGAMPPEILGPLLCDGRLRTAVTDEQGAVLRLGRSTRLASPAQRLALAARDGGCVIPGCSAPSGRCEAHHVVWWRQGGATDLDNLALLCGRHHTEVHLGIWEVSMRAGVPWVVPPAMIDPMRRPVRNELRTGVRAARRLGARVLRARRREPPRGNGPPQSSLHVPGPGL